MRVKYEKKDSIAYITLNRPHVLNAMDYKMHQQLCEIWDDFENDNNLLLGVLTGAGGKAFSVGQDLKEQARLFDTAKQNPASLGSKGKSGWPRLTERFNLVKPLIAKVDGYALGGGFEIALACDIIVATIESSFALPEAKLGLIPGAGGIFRLSRQIPLKKAMGYLLTGRTISATKALELGLINDVVSKKDLDKCVNDWIDDILTSAPLSINAIKDIINNSQDLTLQEAMSKEYYWENLRKSSSDAKEGAMAFSSGRKPKWSGA